VPLVQAAMSARTVVKNRHVAAGVEGAIEQVHEGAALHRALADNAALPALALRT